MSYITSHHNVVIQSFFTQVVCYSYTVMVLMMIQESFLMAVTLGFYITVNINFSVNVPPFHYFTISYLSLGWNWYTWFYCFIGFIGGHIQYNSCLDAKPIMSVCLYSSLYLKCCPSSLQRSSASANPYILGLCLFKLDDVFYQSFFQLD